MKTKSVKVVSTFGGIDICVNNASAIFIAGTLNTPMKRYDLMHQINARVTFYGVASVPVAFAQSGQSTHLEHCVSLESVAGLVWSARGLHDGQVRYELLCIGDGGGTQGARRCR